MDLHEHLQHRLENLISGMKRRTTSAAPDISPDSDLAMKLPQEPEEIGVMSTPPLAPTWGSVVGYVDDGEDLQPMGSQRPITLPTDETDDRKLVIPIQVQDNMLGVIELEENETGRPWTDSDRAVATAIAQDLALTLQDARSRLLTNQALEEMREADTLKNQFIANMSHELRTPLNSIIGFSRVILNEIDGPITEKQEQDLTAICDAGYHLLGLINDILDLSKIEAGRMELSFTEVDLAEIVQGVISTAVGLVKDKHIDLITDLPEDLPMLNADKVRIHQVLLNLVSNAVKFTEEGQVVVSARVIEISGQEEILVAVLDTGPGIRPEDQEELFKPFSQVDVSTTRITGGTGLGLSISRHLIELHGGHIWVESELGQGSTFAFAIPLVTSAPSMAAKQPLILAVDDEPSVLDRYQRYFENRGYRYYALNQTDETVQVASALKPDIILLDLLIPSQTGWQLLSDLRQKPETQAIPVILCAYIDEQNVGISLGAADHVTKPLNEEMLLAAVKRLVSTEDTPFVIIFDDSQEDARDVYKILESGGYRESRIVETTEVGLEEAHQNIPDLIILNLFMSEGGGFRALRILSADPRTQSVPIIVITPVEPEPIEFHQMYEWSEILLQQEAAPEADYMAQIEAILAMLIPKKQIGN
jgi:signal transduction histidine kinase/CheY-like chemotaxis protein